MLAAVRFARVLAVCACACTKPITPTSPLAAAPALEPAPVAVAIEAPPPPVTRCVGGPAGRIELLPSEATMVGAVDLEAVYSSKVFRDNRQSFEKGELQALVEAATACDLGVEHWRRLTFGFETTANDFAVVLAAEGLGEPRNIACIGEAIARKKGKMPWTTVEHSEPPRYDLAAGGAGWVLDQCTVVFASAKWIAPVEQLVAGAGRSVLASAVEPAMRRASVGRHVWFAASLPASTRGSVLDGAQDVAGSIDLSAGFVLATTIGFGNATLASAKAVDIRKTFFDSKAMFSMLGVPQPALDRVEINARGPTVAIDARMTDDELMLIGNVVRKL